jgi:amino acid transporter
MSIFWTLPFPSWEQLISVVSAALVLSYAIAPVTAAGLRRNAPDLPRPFRVRVPGIGPVSFVISALIVFWSGWGTLSWLLGLQIVMFVVYVLCKSKVPVHTVSLAQQVKSSLWLNRFLRADYAFLWLGSFGGTG